MGIGTLSVAAEIVSGFRSAWNSPGVSEFLSAALGGFMTMGAQWLALRHDRTKEAARRKDQQKALVWSVFFKIKEVFEALTSAAEDLRTARAAADKDGVKLWQVFQSPIHDLVPVEWRPEELVLLIDLNQLELMQRYQNSTVWLSNLVQALRLYREMRVEFLTATPSQMQGTTGTIALNSANRQTIMPRVAHLQSLSESLEKVVLRQQPEAKTLLEDFAAAMTKMIGATPELDLE